MKLTPQEKEIIVSSIDWSDYPKFVYLFLDNHSGFMIKIDKQGKEEIAEEFFKILEKVNYEIKSSREGIHTKQETDSMA